MDVTDVLALGIALIATTTVARLVAGRDGPTFLTRWALLGIGAGVAALMAALEMKRGLEAGYAGMLGVLAAAPVGLMLNTRLRRRPMEGVDVSPSPGSV